VGLRSWFNGWSLFTILLVYCIFGPQIWQVLAQAGVGYVKIASTSGLSQIDTTVVDGSVYLYEVTAANAAGESTPVSTGPAVIPAMGVHSVTLAWGASSSPGVTYNVYRELVVLPNPPGAATEIVN
jgi:hypothetical protein